MTPSEAVMGTASHAAHTSEEEEPVAAQLCFFCVLLVLSFSFAHIVKKSCVAKWMPESICVLLVGIVASLGLNLIEILSGHTGAATKWNVAWSSSLFFFVLLPPIVFSAAYHAKRGIFYRNAVPIGLLAILGTLISNLVMTAGLYWAAEFGLLGNDVHMSLMELVAFGALISSTDPVATLSVFSQLKVDPDLFYTIFGESILNDAIAITAFRSATKYIAQDLTQRHAMEYLLVGFLLDFLVTFVGSMILGYVLGLVSALWFKHMNLDRHEHIATIGLMISFVLLPYYLSETIGLSGIVATLFSGISVRRYTKKNISASGHLASSFLFHLLSSLAEMSCFLLVGLNLYNVSALSNLHGRLILFALVLCLVGRAFAVYPLLGSLNLVRLLRGGTHEPPSTPANTSLSLNESPTSPVSVRVARNPHNPGFRAPAPPSPTNEFHRAANTLVPLKTMNMIFLSGLRGVVAFACAANFSNANGNQQLFVATTSVVILFTLVVFGSTAEHWCAVLQVPTGIDSTLFLQKIRASERAFRSTSTGEKPFEERFLYPYVLSEKAKRRISDGQIHSPFELDTSGGGSYRAPHDTADPDTTSGLPLSPERSYSSGTPPPSSSSHSLVPPLHPLPQRHQTQPYGLVVPPSLFRGGQEIHEIFRQIDMESLGMSPYLVDRSDDEPNVEADGVV